MVFAGTLAGKAASLAYLTSLRVSAGAATTLSNTFCVASTLEASRYCRVTRTVVAPRKLLLMFAAAIAVMLKA